MDTETRAHELERARSPAWPVAFAIALVPYLALVLRFDWICDDAFISFRYSRHLAEGLGLRFNAAEAPPVEGYSNLLWVLLLTPFELVGMDLVGVARVLTILCGVALLALVTQTASRELGLGFAATLATALFLAVLPPISIWSTGGLETMPFALALFALFERTLAAERRPVWAHLAGLWAGITVLLRADGALWAAVAIAAAALFPAGTSPRARLRPVAVALAWLAGAVLAQLAFRLGYHGELVSNTAHAKAGFSPMRLERGVDYVVSFFLTLPVLALVPIAAVARRGGGRRGLTPRALAVVLFAAGWALYVGGDFMAMGRLLVPSLAFIALLFGVALRGVERRPLAWLGAAAAVALALAPSFDLHPVPRSLRERFHFRWSSPEMVSELAQWRTMQGRTARWERTARALALHTRPGESIVYGAIGAVGYRTDLHVFDPLGLVSPEVARRGEPPRRASPGHDLRVPPEWFIERQPDYLGAFVVPRSTPARAGIRPEWRRSDWYRRLRVERVPLPSGPDFAEGSELRLLRLDWSR